MAQAIMRTLVLVWAVAAAVRAEAQVPVSIHVAGHIVDDETGTGIRGAQVMLMLTTMPSAPRWVRASAPPRTTTDAEGAFAFEVSFAGRYRIVATREGFARSDSAPTVDVIDGRPLDDLVVTLSRGGLIAGRVWRADGNADGNFTVTALRRRVDLNGHVSTSMGPLERPTADGTFRISLLPAGEYVVVASPLSAAAKRSADESTVEAPTFFPGTTDLQTAQGIVVGKGDTITGIDFQMASATFSTIEGTVVKEDASPVAHAWIVLTWNPRDAGAGPMRSPSAWSGDDGKFTMTGVLPGSYTMLASVPIPRQPRADGILSGPNGEALSPPPPGSPRASLAVTVGSEGVRNLRLVLR